VVGFFFLLLQISLFDLWSFPNDTEKQNSLEIRLHQKFHSVHTKMNISSAAWQSLPHMCGLRPIALRRRFSPGLPLSEKTPYWNCYARFYGG
jgi:hypothetical protein